MSSNQGALQAELDRLCFKHHWPGATVAISGPGGQASAAAGVSDRGSGRAMQVGDRLLPASVGKLVTAAVAVRLAHAGHLDLDVPVSRWLGQMPSWKAPLSERPISLRHLLQHRSGLADYPELPAFAAWQAEMADLGNQAWLKPEQAIDMALQAGLLYPPDALTVYSDTGYLLAGLALEAATGRDFYALADDLVLKPALMSSTTPNHSPELAGLVQGYGDPQGRFSALETVLDDGGRLRYHPRTEWTGGGFVSTAEDVRALVNFLFDGGLEPACSFQMLNGAQPIYDRTPAAHYGLGVVITPTTLGPSLGHTGSIPGYRTLAAYFPVYRCSVALMVNSDRPDWSMLHEARESLGLIAARSTG